MTPGQAQVLMGDVARKFKTTPPPEEMEFWLRRLEPVGYTTGVKVMSKLGTAKTWPTGADFDRVLNELTITRTVVPPSVMPEPAPAARRVLDRTENASRAREIRAALRDRMRSVRQNP